MNSLYCAFSSWKVRRQATPFAPCGSLTSAPVLYVNIILICLHFVSQGYHFDARRVYCLCAYVSR